jgi:hypothetical protein
VRTTTLENVTVEVTGMVPQTIALSIDEEGLVIGPYGKLSWVESKVSAEGDCLDLCIIHVETSTGASSTFTIPESSLHGRLSPPEFARSFLRAAAHFGATVITSPVPA